MVSTSWTVLNQERKDQVADQSTAEEEEQSREILIEEATRTYTTALSYQHAGNIQAAKHMFEILLTSAVFELRPRLTTESKMGGNKRIMCLDFTASPLAALHFVVFKNYGELLEIEAESDLEPESVYARVLDLYQRALRLDPSDSLLAQRAGRLALKLHSPEVAIDAFSLALRGSVHSATLVDQAKLGLSIALYESGDFQECLETVATILAKHPRDVTARWLQHHIMDEMIRGLSSTSELEDLISKSDIREFYSSREENMKLFQTSPHLCPKFRNASNDLRKPTPPFMHIECALYSDIDSWVKLGKCLGHLIEEFGSSTDHDPVEVQFEICLRKSASGTTSQADLLPSSPSMDIDIPSSAAQDLPLEMSPIKGISLDNASAEMMIEEPPASLTSVSLSSSPAPVAVSRASRRVKELIANADISALASDLPADFQGKISAILHAPAAILSHYQNDNLMKKLADFNVSIALNRPPEIRRKRFTFHSNQGLDAEYSYSKREAELIDFVKDRRCNVIDWTLSFILICLDLGCPLAESHGVPLSEGRNALSPELANVMIPLIPNAHESLLELCNLSQLLVLVELMTDYYLRVSVSIELNDIMETSLSSQTFSSLLRRSLVHVAQVLDLSYSSHEDNVHTHTLECAKSDTKPDETAIQVFRLRWAQARLSASDTLHFSSDSLPSFSDLMFPSLDFRMSLPYICERDGTCLSISFTMVEEFVLFKKFQALVDDILAKFQSKKHADVLALAVQSQLVPSSSCYDSQIPEARHSFEDVAQKLSQSLVGIKSVDVTRYLDVVHAIYTSSTALSCTLPLEFHVAVLNVCIIFFSDARERTLDDEVVEDVAHLSPFLRLLLNSVRAIDSFFEEQGNNEAVIDVLNFLASQQGGGGMLLSFITVCPVWLNHLVMAKAVGASQKNVKEDRISNLSLILVRGWSFVLKLAQKDLVHGLFTLDRKWHGQKSRLPHCFMNASGIERAVNVIHSEIGRRGHCCLDQGAFLRQCLVISPTSPQVIFCLYGIDCSSHFRDSSFVSPHSSPGLPLDAFGASLIFNLMKSSHLPYDKDVLDKLSAAVGPPPMNIYAISYNSACISSYLEEDVHAMDAAPMAKPRLSLSNLTAAPFTSDRIAFLARKDELNVPEIYPSLYWVQIDLMTRSYGHTNNKTLRVFTVLREAATLLIHYLTIMPRHREAWLKLGLVYYNLALDTMSWSSEMIRQELKETQALLKKAYLCLVEYLKLGHDEDPQVVPSLSSRIRTTPSYHFPSQKDELDFWNTLGELILCLLSEPFPPLLSERKLACEEWKRRFGGSVDSAQNTKVCESSMQPSIDESSQHIELLGLAGFAFKKALALDMSDFQLPLLIATVYKKMDKDPQLVIRYYLKSIKSAPSEWSTKEQTIILHPAISFLSFLSKKLYDGKMSAVEVHAALDSYDTMEHASLKSVDLVQSVSSLQSVTGINKDSESCFQRILAKLGAIRTVDKKSWQHVSIYLESWIYWTIFGNLERAMESMSCLFNLKLTSKSFVHFFKPEFERQGAHFIYVHRYLVFYATLIASSGDMSRLMLLLRKVRKHNQELLVYPDRAWQHVYECMISCLRFNLNAIGVDVPAPLTATAGSHDEILTKLASWLKKSSSAPSFEAACISYEKNSFAAPLINGGDALLATLRAILLHGYELFKLNSGELNDGELVRILLYVYAAAMALCQGFSLNYLGSVTSSDESPSNVTSFTLEDAMKRIAGVYRLLQGNGGIQGTTSSSLTSGSGGMDVPVLPMDVDDSVASTVSSLAGDQGDQLNALPGSDAAR